MDKFIDLCKKNESHCVNTIVGYRSGNRAMENDGMAKGEKIVRRGARYREREKRHSCYWINRPTRARLMSHLG